ncbi:hypothetical protein [Ochrobactrum sp. Marseille-Q0166]|uniref:hypothetical protein n=1 Tax=Ochrobactrum sp. Marseille-Q0166 TaxID=2761105 RepID=UPI00165645EC|nr:hypothetical protein [Ochrobactrum sp. Marseille-Q0166]MBC8719548.1 hypothetical protein [Ochrobactrum sp. Marseille-Q0166]
MNLGVSRFIASDEDQSGTGQHLELGTKSDSGHTRGREKMRPTETYDFIRQRKKSTASKKESR